MAVGGMAVGVYPAGMPQAHASANGGEATGSASNDASGNPQFLEVLASLKQWMVRAKAAAAKKRAAGAGATAASVAGGGSGGGEWRWSTQEGRSEGGVEGEVIDGSALQTMRAPGGASAGTTTAATSASGGAGGGPTAATPAEPPLLFSTPDKVRQGMCSCFYASSACSKRPHALAPLPTASIVAPAVVTRTESSELARIVRHAGAAVRDGYLHKRTKGETRRA